ncbi:Pentatricopeptide repeat [Dillenia turbinata]|uniref:Pentatricopeptide repeat n=1 Tax=Dillenia turbinata TaxID=194707 RepID=A0AAN8UPT7_9MAGN
MHCSHLIHQLQNCAKLHAPLGVKTLHAHIIKLGFNHFGPFQNSLIDCYGKCALVHAALQLFDEMPQRDLISWASILTAHTQANLPHRTISIFRSMFWRDFLQPDHFVIACIVKACASLAYAKHGRQVHAHFVVSQFYDDDVIKSSLVDMYGKCGLPDDGRAVFDSISVKSSVSWTAMVSGYARSGQKVDAVELLRGMPVRNLFSWTALISGLVQSGNSVDAFDMFNEMRRAGVEIFEPLVLSSIVGAAANLVTLELGKQVHCLVICLGYENSLFVSNALVDMYAKCSDILMAKDIFNRMQQRNVVSWTSMIVGMAQHGQAKEALLLYDEMVLNRVQPNEVTFIGLLYACSHVGLVSKGRYLFNYMIEDCGISPSLQHYTCLLDLFCRSGHLDEAEDLIKVMPFEPDEPTWAALLSACKHHGKIDVGVRIADHVLCLNPEDPSTYILLSNIYAGASMWESVSMVRRLMAASECRKQPGHSCIDLGKETQVFYAGEISHPLKDEIFDLLTDLDIVMKKRGYVPDTSYALHDVEDHERERMHFWHCERLAVASSCKTDKKSSSIWRLSHYRQIHFWYYEEGPNCKRCQQIPPF